MFPKRLNRAPFVLAYVACNVIALAILIYTGDREVGTAIAGLLVLAVIVPLGVARLHDLDITGWLVLVLFIPGVGSIGALLLCFAKGTEGENRFGPDPLGEGPTVLPEGSMGLALAGPAAVEPLFPERSHDERS